MNVSSPREVADDALEALVSGNSEQLAKLLAPDARMRVTGDFAYAGTVEGRAEIAEFIAVAFDRLKTGHPSLRLDGSIRRLVAEDNVVAAEILSTPDYALLISVEEGLIESMTMYFDTRAYTEIRSA